MEAKNKKYFERMMNYKSPKFQTIFADSQQDIDYSSSQIRNIAKDALNEKLSPNSAKEEISKLIKIIKDLNKK
ncbi:MAG: hypothetical protein WC812_00875 [Candidatus Pacearchaeota archaeon]|jgi:hypothetical protein